MQTHSPDSIAKIQNSIAVSYSHDICTSLSAIKMGMNHIKIYLPILIQTYKTAKQNAQISSGLPDSLLDLFEELVDVNLNEVDYALLLLNLFSENLCNSQLSDHIEDLSMIACLKKAFAEYPYRTDFEKTLSRPILAFNDFIIYANPYKMHSILSGIIHNILTRTNFKQQFSICIDCTSSTTHQTLSIKDQGQFLQPDESDKLFENPLFTQHQDPKASLFYCKKIMENMSGNIYCHSKEGETTFFLIFPVEKK